ncbi:hypothetical protein PUW21_11080 [Bacillus subtilis]|uniref:hypothetical protein n=1 Tax=Bacillus subtilis TaxID=1423 RepID=UPI000846551D|nr:hypothetical protein [Bacillus subtilis]AOL97914.1 hypothetical protein BS16045_02197 [Bacillus subtilis]WDI23556.1 hypothetical protein PUW21_11080 [Bacillus subtilis]
MIRATEKQLRLIGRMEQYISERYTGNTIKEASEFITNHTKKRKKWLTNQMFYMMIFTMKKAGNIVEKY